MGGEDCVGWDVDIGVGAGVHISDIITYKLSKFPSLYSSGLSRNKPTGLRSFKSSK